jgi:hypothetical protein
MKPARLAMLNVVGSCLLALLPAGLQAAEGTVVWRFSTDDSLEQINAVIQHNGYKFTVGHNWVADMPREEKQQWFKASLIAIPEAYSALTDIGPLTTFLPKPPTNSYFCWTNCSDHTWIGPVRNQGRTCGSCYAFAACAAAEGTYDRAMGKFDSDCADFSEAFIAFGLSETGYGRYLRGCDGGVPPIALDALTVIGVCFEKDFPYTGRDTEAAAAWDKPRVRFSSAHMIPCGDIAAIKTAILNYGPVVAAVKVIPAFEYYSGGIYEDENTGCDQTPCYRTDANHSIALVGWNDNGGNGYWILRNSWGPEWGEGGYMRIEYFSARVACSAAYLVYTPAPLPPPASGDRSTLPPPQTKRPEPSRPATAPTPAMLESFNNDSWNDLSRLFARGTSIYLHTQNAYSNKASVTIWAAYSAPQQFSLCPYAEPKRDNDKFNYAARAKLKTELVAQPGPSGKLTPELEKRLAADGVGSVHRRMFADAYVYRIYLEAVDAGNGSFGSYILKSSSLSVAAIVKADIDDGYVPTDKSRARAGVMLP